jgi:hypothetical protein
MNHPGIFAAGIFAHENGQRLLQILMQLTTRGFGGLYEKCMDDVAGTYYQTGLKRVHAWSNEVLEEDVAHVKRNSPDIEETYGSCFVQYVSERFQYRGRGTTRTPPLIEFVRRFLECVGQQDALVNGSYFRNADTLTQRVVCMDAARQALYTLVTTESVRVELESEVGSVKPPPPEAERSETRNDADRQTTVSRATSMRGRSVVYDDIRPSDSVSQVTPHDFGASPEEEMVIPAKEHERRGEPERQPSVEERVARDDAKTYVTSSHTARARPIQPEGAPPPPKTVVSSVASRHVFDEQRDGDRKAVATSRDSQVSIGVKRVGSPKR